jgi:integrase
MYVCGKGPNRTRHTLGRYDPPRFTLAIAREKARDIAAQERLSPRARMQSPTYREALRTFFRTYSTQRHRATTRREVERHHERHFLPTLGDFRLSDIETGDIVAILDRILNTPSEANHAFQHARAFFRWAVKRRLIERSPMEGLDRPAATFPRTRVLTPNELVAAWQACGHFSHFGPYVRALILTGQRRGQISYLRADMIDVKKKIITWPSDLMKTGLEHSAPYGPMMARLMIGVSNKDLVFPSSRDMPFTDSGGSKRDLDKLCPMPHWTLHDLRRTWATISAEELDTPPHIIEAVLAHQSGTAVARTYNRAKYIEPMRKALIAFEEWLQRFLSNKENVNGAELTRRDYEGQRAAE